jgi:hypothetical protein
MGGPPFAAKPRIDKRGASAVESGHIVGEEGAA